jgi:hypothetical protein
MEKSKKDKIWNDKDDRMVKCNNEGKENLRAHIAFSHWDPSQPTAHATVYMITYKLHTPSYLKQQVSVLKVIIRI